MRPADAEISTAGSGFTPPPTLVRVALLGNPNTGKTTLFNRLTGLRHKTGNFPGTTLESRVGRTSVASAGQEFTLDLIDLPGVYSLELQQAEAEIARDVLEGRAAPPGLAPAEPNAALLVLDGTNLGRNLVLAGEALRRRLPTVLAINMVDLARKQGLHIDGAEIERAVGCPVVLVSARSGEGIPELRAALARVLETGAVPTRTAPGDEAGLRAWAEDAFIASTSGEGALVGRTFTDRADLVLTHPVLGVLGFAVVMAGLFLSVFVVAQYPMTWIEGLFKLLGNGIDALWAATGAASTGLLHDLLKDGVVAGVGSTVVFLPQIVLLFFLISLLEDSGYLARAAFVMDRALRPFGLPGHSFVPLLSSHACALPGIMSTRGIPDRRQRLATILVAPFMTCSARLPVYVLLIGILFASNPLAGALAFIGCYALGMFAGIFSALLARRTILRGAPRPMALELPTYKWPSFQTAFITSIDRALVFLKKAGTAILAVSIVLWWLGSFPRIDPPARAEALRQQALDVGAGKASAPLPAPDDKDREGFLKLTAEAQRTKAVETLNDEADRVEHRAAKAGSFLAQAARTVQPAFAPLGYDWQLTVGVLASFAAREVFVSTMSVVISGGQDDEDETIRESLAGARRDDGVTPLFTRATCWSLLVFYVLAMQCLATLVVTAREAGHVKWALLQFGWMSLLAYLGALLAYRLAGGA